MAFSLLRSDLADYADPTAPLLRPDVTRLVQQTTPMGASLRPVQPALTPDERDALEASGMTSLRRGYEAGRLGTDANAAFAREASLRADGRVAEAEAERLDALGAQRRAGIYSPAVTRVEDINGVGDAATWLAGQVGQGAASMQDPLAASAALTAVGTGLSFIPQTRLIGAGLRNLAAPGAAYAINAQQLKGEHYGNISEDPAVTARYTPQQLNEQANLYGLGAGALETALPAMAGRALGGGALLRKAASLPGGLKFAGDLGLEGTTELIQGEASRALHSELNPSRDTSGDASNRLNEFLGGAAGAAGPGAIHAGADAAFSLPRRMGEVAREAVGTATDLAKDTAKGAFGKAKDKVSDLSDSLRAASAEKDDTRLADLSLLRGLPDDPAVAENPEAFRAWLKETTPKRTERVAQGLNELATAGDARAAELLAELSDPDPSTQVEALNAGSEHLIDAQGLRELAEEADAALDGQGEKPAASRLAARGGDFLGRVARRAGQTAADGAKGLWDGLTRRQNRQWTGPEYEAARHRAMGAFDEAAGVAAAQQRSLARAELMGEILAERAKAQTPRYVAHRLSPERITAHLGTVAQDLADLAESWGMTGQREVAADKRGQQFDNLKVELGSIASTLRIGLKDDALPAVQAMRRVADPGAAPLFDYLEQEIQAQQQPGGGQRAAAVQREAADHLVGMIPPETLLKLSKQGVDMTSAGAARTLMSTVRQAVRGSARATKQLDGLFGRETTNRMLEAMSMTPSQRMLEEAYTSESAGSASEEDGPDFGSDKTAGADEEAGSDFEKRQGEKAVGKRAGAALYGFVGMTAKPDRTLGGRPIDPLAFGKGHRPRLYDLRTTAEQDGQAKPEELKTRAALLEAQKRKLAARIGANLDKDEEAEGGQSEWTFSVRSALEDMAKREGVSLQTALGPYSGQNQVVQVEGDGPRTKSDPDSVSERLGLNTAFINRVIARYRDFMRDEGARAESSEDPNAVSRARAYHARADAADAVLKDRAAQARSVGRAQAPELQTSAELREDILRRAIGYLSNFGVVVAERATNRDPETLSVDQVVLMAQRGRQVHDAVEQGVDKNELLQFESMLRPDKKGQPGAMFVRSTDLVKLARAARRDQAAGDSTSSNNAYKQYLADLSDGIAMLVDSGFVEGLPRGYEDGKIPDSLPLPPKSDGTPMTYGKLRRSVEYRAKERAKKHEPLSEFSTVPGTLESRARVGKDQLRGSERVPQDADVAESINDPMSPSERRHYDSLQSAVARAAFVRQLAEKNGPKWREAFEAYRAPQTVTRVRPKVVEGSVRDDIVASEGSVPFGERGDEAESFIIANRVRPGDTGPLTKSKRALDAESTRATEIYRLKQRRATLLESGVPEDGNSIARIDARLADLEDAAAKEDAAPAGKSSRPSGAGSAQSDVTITAHDSSGYQARTKHNADSAGLTVAIAHDFETAGERLTRRVSEGKYLAVPIDLEPAKAGLRLAKAMRQLDTTTLNVAGNGIYTLAGTGRTQAQVNQHVYETIKAAHELRPITKIVTGGQTGVDIAGAIAARALGIPVAVTMPRGFRQRNAQGVDENLSAAIVRAQIEDGARALEKGGSADGFSPARKLNAQATQLHREIGRPGFAATHDSPVRHEGRFNWREHAGKGEGNAAFGAGTYLSTGDGVHRYYKKMFTAQVEPEYEYMAADRVSAQLHRAVGARTEISSDTAKIAVRKGKDEAVAFVQRTLDEHFREGPEGTISQTEFDKWSGRYKKLLEAIKAMPESEMRPRRVEGFRGEHSPTYQVSVDIPPERLLDWDKPLSKQGPTVRLRAMKAIKDNQLDEMAATYEGIDVDMSITGKEMYKALTKKLGTQAKASDYLQSLGILGHVYAAANGSDGKSPNYVIYDDSKIHTNFVAFNKQDPGNLGPMTDEQKTVVRVEIERLLGKQVAVDFRNIVGYSGEWIEARNVIEISTAAGPNAMSVGHHEALHAFFSKFVESDPRVKEAMVALADNQGVLKRLQALLADHPKALEDLKYGEERLAYMYQFWAADMLDLPGKATTLFQKIHRFFRRVLGRITDEERAAAIVEAFHRGEMSEPSAAGQVIAKAMAEGTTAIKLARKADAALVRARGLIYAARGTLNTSESPTARLIGQMFWTNPGEERDSDAGEGYINAKEAAATKYKNLFAEVISDLSDRDLRDVAKILQSTNYDADIKDVLAKISYAPHRDAVEKIHKLLARFHDYMTRERGMQIGKLNNYFPRVWNTGLLLEKQDDFVNMLLTKYDSVLADGAKSSGLSKEQVAQRIYQKLVNNGSAEHVLPSRDDGVLAPFFENSMTRELKWLQNADAEPFLSKDLIGTLTGYFHMGARAAEYTQRFGQGGEKLAAMLKTVDTELQTEGKKLVARGEMDNAAMKAWAARRMAQVEKSVGAMEGTLGSDIGSTWRNLNTWVTVYQNLRLLPLALFSSLVDPMGLVARGGTMRDAYDTFLRGMREVGRTWADMVAREPKQRQKDHWEKVAEYVGAVDAATFSHHVADEYSSLYMGKKAKRINDTFFRLNGMEAWNRGARVGATQAAVRFLEHHAKLPDTHSERWLKELGLKQSDLHFAADGSLITSKVDLRGKYLAEGVKPAEADAKAEVEIEKTHYAIRRWVQGAVLTPNAAQRPAWSSDPHYSMFFHLKQFSYSFHQTLIKRAVNELDHGNLMPLGAFAWYIPVMVGSNIMRGMLQGGGELPAHMQGMSVADHINKAVWQTIGATGAIAVDASHDLASLAGPMVEQAIDAMGQPIGRTITDALPAKPLYVEALR